MVGSKLTLPGESARKGIGLPGSISETIDFQCLLFIYVAGSQNEANGSL